MKIRSVGAELLYVDGHTDTTKLIVAFHNFVNMPKNGVQRKNARNNDKRLKFAAHSQ
jgi:hypothetical protein